MSKKKYVDIPQTKALARGNWHTIFTAFVAAYDHRLFEKAGRKHGPCPLCGGNDRFQFFKDAKDTGGSVCRHCGAKPDGFDLVGQANDWDFIETARQIDALLNGEEVSAPKPVDWEKLRKQQEEATKRQKEKDEFFRSLLKKVWKESYRAEAPEAAPLRRYLANRGLDVHNYPRTLRFHPGLDSVNEDGEFEGTFPVMLALVVDKDGAPVTIHRTYLTEDGRKAPIESPKKLMPYPSDKSVSGGAIHLSGTGKVLNVAEGIETALAVQEMVGGSVWATVNASMMKNLQVGEPVEAVWSWGDLDRSGDGQAACKELVERLRKEGKQATACLPTMEIPAGAKSIDWLDVYLKWHDSSVIESLRFIKASQRAAA